MLRLLYYFLPCLLLACQPQASTSTQKQAAEIKAPGESQPSNETGLDNQSPKPIPIDWANPQELIPDAIFDLRYATTNNFVGEQLYPCPTCWLRPPAAQALVSVADTFRKAGYRLILFDCYRPVPVQERLWAIKPDATYVTPPAKGSMHNRGLAVDIGLADMEGIPYDMGTAFDFFGRKAHHDFYDLDADILARRTLLKEQMASAGFGHIRSEWWHYSFQKQSANLSREQWPCPDDVK